MRSPGFRPRPLVVATLVALLGGGCAVKSAEPMSPAAEATMAAPPADAAVGSEAAPQQAPAPVTSAAEGDPVAELAEAEGALDRALGGATPAPAEPDPKKAEVARPRSEAGGGDACEVACRALASMRRSADRLCELSSGDAGRCDDARARVTRAEGRVRDRCPACHGAR